MDSPRRVPRRSFEGPFFSLVRFIIYWDPNVRLQRAPSGPHRIIAQVDVIINPPPPLSKTIDPWYND